jgi:hypothetical protein
MTRRLHDDGLTAYASSEVGRVSMTDAKLAKLAGIWQGRELLAANRNDRRMRSGQVEGTT